MSPQVRDNLSEILGKVKFGEEIVTIEKKGKPYAVIISPGQYEALQAAAKGKLRATVAAIHARNADYTEDEVQKDVTEIVDQVRQERYDQDRT